MGLQAPPPGVQVKATKHNPGADSPAAPSFGSGRADAQPGLGSGIVLHARASFSVCLAVTCRPLVGRKPQ